MKKKLLALFAACSMITTAVAGLVQTAYADDTDLMSMVVTDGASENQKVLTIYYGCEGTFGFQGTLSFDGGDVEIDSVNVTPQYATGMGDKAQEIADDKKTANIGLGYYDDPLLTTSDKSLAVINVTVLDDDVDITANFAVEFLYDENWDDHTDLGTISATIPKKEVAPPTPVVSTSVEASQAFTEADNFDANVVVGTIQLTVSDAPIDLTKVTYNDKEPEKVEGTDNPTAFQGSALITVIINGATNVDALNNIKFN